MKWTGKPSPTELRILARMAFTDDPVALRDLGRGAGPVTVGNMVRCGWARWDRVREASDQSTVRITEDGRRVLRWHTGTRRRRVRP